MNPLVSAVIGSMVRWIVTIAAAQGVMVTEDTATQIVSGVVAFAMLVWSFYQKHQTDKRIARAKATGL